MFAEDIYIAAAEIQREESELLGLLCAAAEEEFMKRLRPDVDVRDIKTVFVTACAMLACSMYASATGEAAKSWRVGQVAVSGDCNWQDLRDRAEAILAGYLDSGSGFEFMGV